MKSRNRRGFLATAVAVGATLCLPGTGSAAGTGSKTFTILHTNDLHSNLIGTEQATDYTPSTLNDDTTRGGYGRPTSDSLTPSGTHVSARLTGLAWDQLVGKRFLHLGVSGRYAGADGNTMRYKGRPESNVADIFLTRLQWID